MLQTLHVVLQLSRPGAPVSWGQQSQTKPVETLVKNEVFPDQSFYNRFSAHPHPTPTPTQSIMLIEHPYRRNSLPTGGISLETIIIRVDYFAFYD